MLSVNLKLTFLTLMYKTRIVSILSSLDNKIELNRRINDNLIPTYYA